jgi:hypothetical protein
MKRKADGTQKPECTCALKDEYMRILSTAQRRNSRKE